MWNSRFMMLHCTVENSHKPKSFNELGHSCYLTFCPEVVIFDADKFSTVFLTPVDLHGGQKPKRNSLSFNAGDDGD